VTVSLRLLPDRLAVCRLEPGSPLPEWSAGGGFRSVSWTADETSVVCSEANVPAKVRAERGWRAFMVEGPLDFGQTGVLAGIAQPLAAAGISIFSVSTFDTDYVLVRDAAVVEAQRVLAEAENRLVVGATAGAAGRTVPETGEAAGVEGAAVEGAAGPERGAGPEARPDAADSPGAAAALSWIQRWYAGQCDGDWEHDYGVSIENIDNPGWWVKIDLKDTDLEAAPFAEISRPEPESDWLSCRITEGRWEGVGGPHMLGEILAVFGAWAREVSGAG